MEILSIIMFALSLNMDTLGVGIAYGIKKIRIPIKSLIVITLMSVIAISISMTTGDVINNVLPEIITSKLGSIALIIIGGLLLSKSYKSKNKRQMLATSKQRKTFEKTNTKLKPKILETAFQLVHEPLKADVDKSGTISTKEAVLLGFALALDAFVAGFAVSLIGFDILNTVIIVGVGYILMMCLGLKIGNRIAVYKDSIRYIILILPGFILITIGIIKLLF
ncbi:sporulation membrane protein YtaF [Peptococcaceae bacterium]|nr:sporulation membrane protein YtaF [Peptococcaceae bacterium]